MNEWISVNDQLPLYKQCILVWLDNEYVADAVYRGEYEKNIHVFRIELMREDISCLIAKGINSRISHWMPIPNPPEKE